MVKDTEETEVSTQNTLEVHMGKYDWANQTGPYFEGSLKASRRNLLLGRSTLSLGETVLCLDTETPTSATHSTLCLVSKECSSQVCSNGPQERKRTNSQPFHRELSGTTH